ncbi:hypothetical protein [Microbacterium sp. 18062]|uniref:hypothetical protein n=1 Tax=Microbacterium sp. 18062 TaxID=2681410 RepID=UPI0013597797|nr:hypothetical protein [Microbacterium sp. 18062]
MHIRSAAILLVLPVLALVGCTASANLTVDAGKISEQATEALHQSNPELEIVEIDCGDGNVDLVEGEIVDCVATDTTSGAELGAKVTLSDVEGTSYHLSVKIDDAPTNSPTATSAPEGLTVPSTTLAELAAGALAEQLGFTPTITCSPADVPLVVDEQIRCMTTAEDGAAATTLITITEVNGTDYKINAEIQ